MATPAITDRMLSVNPAADSRCTLPRDCAFHLFKTLYHSRTGAAICDRTLRYTAINPALAAMNGLPVEAHAGKTLHDVLGGAAKEVEKSFAYVIKEARPMLGVEASGLRPFRPDAGSWIRDVLPIEGRRSQIVGVLVLVIEVEKPPMLKEELVDLLEQLSDWSDTHSKTLVELNRRFAANGQTSMNSTAKAEWAGILTHRETEVVRLLVGGKSTKEIAAESNRSVKTVEQQRETIKIKLGVKSLQELVLYAVKHGMIAI